MSSQQPAKILRSKVVMSPASPDPLESMPASQKSTENDSSQKNESLQAPQKNQAAVVEAVNDCQASQKMMESEEEEGEDSDDDDEIKPLRKTRRMDYPEKAGFHTHFEHGNEMPCVGTPWGRITLLEHDMPRSQLMKQKYVERFQSNYGFSLHFAIIAYKEAKLDIFKPVEKKGPIILYYQLLNNPPNFSYRCMTLYDMELLRITILEFFGVTKCDCNGFMGLSFGSIENDMSKLLVSKTKSALKTIGSYGLKTLVKECDLKILCQQCSE